ncbi:hypothetical protein V7x_12640 [Crateriforma conspicua]|uniref:Uncharacterized protein n=2 Tax=Planctomycetaceae TaxID=126 RepID=A0A5C6FVR1_9PLAN|nr:hypothetical protein V7x_12640 [Crateriforma conspicua]
MATMPCEFHGIVVAVAIVAVTVERFALLIESAKDKRGVFPDGPLPPTWNPDGRGRRGFTVRR